jgi:uncharacterized protein
MIIKFIILIIVIWFGLRIYQKLQLKKLKKVAPAKSQDMVSCETCGIHLPVGEAIKNGDKYFCSRNHLPKSD